MQAAAEKPHPEKAVQATKSLKLSSSAMVMAVRLYGTPVVVMGCDIDNNGERTFRQTRIIDFCGDLDRTHPVISGLEAAGIKDAHQVMIAFQMCSMILNEVRYRPHIPSWPVYSQIEHAVCAIKLEYDGFYDRLRRSKLPKVVKDWFDSESLGLGRLMEDWAPPVLNDRSIAIDWGQTFGEKSTLPGD